MIHLFTLNASKLSFPQTDLYFIAFPKFCILNSYYPCKPISLVVSHLII